MQYFKYIIKMILQPPLGMSLHWMRSLLVQKRIMIRGVIGEVRCGFLWIYTPTPYSAVFLLHAPTLAPIKIGFGAVRCGLVWCGVGAVLRFGLDSFGPDWAS
jgi:hypothetical protein